jgi:propionyl-CoA synthetase
MGDEGMIDSRGYLHILSRIDDVINVAGHRLDTGRIEEAINNH